MLISESAHGPRITAVNKAGSAAGAQIGQRLVDARALSPELQSFAADAEGDLKTLERLTLWTQRWGPWSMMDGGDAIILDVTGAVHLSGNEQMLLHEIDQQLSKRGFDNRPAMAATAGAAWALSHYASKHAVADAENAKEHLRVLPVAALRLEPDILILLRRLGLKRIDDLMRVPRNDLARRFRNHRNPQTNPLVRLDQLFGEIPEPMIPLNREEPVFVSRRLLEPILHRSLLDQIMRDLTCDMVKLLEGRRLGSRRLELRAYKVDGDIAVRCLELSSATRDADHIMRLFVSKIDDIDAGFGIDQVDLWSTWTLPMALEQANLDNEELRGFTLPQMLDRITARLGQGAVKRPVSYNSHLPERAIRWVRADEPIKPSQEELPFYARPIKLLERAELISVIYAAPDGVRVNFGGAGICSILS